MNEMDFARPAMSPSAGKAWKYAVHPLEGEEALLETGVSSQVVFMGWRSMG